MPRISDENKYFGMSFNHEQVCNAFNREEGPHEIKNVKFNDTTYELTYNKSLPPARLLIDDFSLSEKINEHIDVEDVTDSSDESEKEVSEDDLLPENLIEKFDNDKIDDSKIKSEPNETSFPLQTECKYENVNIDSKKMIEQSTISTQKVAQSADADFMTADIDELFKNNDLNFVPIFLENDKKQLIQTLVTLDCGANLSIVNLHFLTSLPHFNVKIRDTSFEIHHLGSNPSEISEIVELKLLFKTRNKTITLKHHFVVSPTCIYEILVGNDILSRVNAIVKIGKYIKVNANFDNNKGPKYVKFPIINYPSARNPFLASMEYHKIKPFESRLVECRLIQSGLIKPDIKFKCTNHPKAEVQVDEFTIRNDLFQYFILSVANVSNKTVYLKPNSIIANASPIEEKDSDKKRKKSSEKIAMPVNKFKRTLKMHDEKEKKNASVIEAAKIIAQDKYLSPEEKEEALEEFKRTGQFALSASQLVDNGEKITHLPPLDTKDLTEEEILNLIDISHLSEENQILATIFLRKNVSVFAKNSVEAGRTSLIEAYVKIKDGMSNRIFEQKRIPIQPALLPQVRAMIQKMIEYDLIEKCDITDAKCIMNLLALPKENNPLALRCILDSRLCNSLCVKFHCMNPTKSEIFQFLGKRKFISQMDINQGFFHLSVEKESRNYFCFTDGASNVFRFKVLPQGHLNSSSFFSAMISKLIFGLECLAYVDDILATDFVTKEHANNENCTFQDHLNGLQVLMDRFKKENIKLSAKKFRLANPVISMIGYVIEHDKIHMNETRRINLARFPMPRNPSQMNSWLCASQYFKDFHQHFSHITAPLWQAAKLPGPSYKVTPQLQEQFLKAQSCFKDVNPLWIHDPTKPLYASSDSSGVAINFCLWQLDENDPTKRKMISNYSRLLTAVERKRDIYFCEAIAMLSGLVKNDYILRHSQKPLTLFTDNLNICYLRVAKDSNPVIIRLIAQLLNYEYSIHFISSKDNQFSDIMSRPYYVDKQRNKKERKTISQAEAIQFLNDLTDIFPDNVHISSDLVRRLLTAHPMYSQKEIPIKKQKEKISTSKDVLPNKVHQKTPKLPPNIRELKNPHIWEGKESKVVNTCTVDFIENMKLKQPSDIIVNSLLLQNGTLSIEDFKLAQSLDSFINEILAKDNLPPTYFLRGGILMKKVHNLEKIVLPLSLLLVWVCNLHVTLQGLHTSKDCMRKIITENFYVHQIDKHLANFTQSCFICYRAKHSPDKKSTFHQTEQSHRARTKISIDLAGGLPPSGPQRYCYIMLICDKFDNFVVLLPLTSKSASEILNKFKYSYLHMAGPVSHIYCDNEPSITDSHEFTTFAKENQIQIKSTASLCAWSNGHAEKNISKIKLLIKAYVDHTKRQWSENLYLLNNLINNLPLSYSNYSPEVLRYGFSNMNNGAPLTFSKLTDNFDSYVEAIDKWSNQRAIESQTNRNKKNSHSRDFLNHTRDEQEFEIGQIVFVKNDIIQGQNAIKLNYEGPFEIIHIFENSNSLCLVRDFASQKVRRVHFMQLRPAKNNFVPFGVQMDTEALDLIRTRNEQKHTYNLRSSRKQQ